MKTDIHPDYVECKVHCSCGNEFVTRSTRPELRVELCSECHPFYTGKQKLVDTGGRVERFQRRDAKAKKKTAPTWPGRSRRQPEPRYMGGQAVVEGVMMRGESTWAVAVRTPDGEIEVDVRDVAGLGREVPQDPDRARRHGARRVAGARLPALTWSANQQIPEEEQVSEKAMGWAVGVAVVVLHRASSSCCPRSRATGSSSHSASTARSTSSRASCGSAFFLGYLLADRRASRTSGACSSTTAPSTRRSPRTRTTSSSRPSRRSSSRPRTCAAAPTSCSP